MELLREVHFCSGKAMPANLLTAHWTEVISKRHQENISDPPNYEMPKKNTLIYFCSTDAMPAIDIHIRFAATSKHVWTIFTGADRDSHIWREWDDKPSSSSIYCYTQLCRCSCAVRSCLCSYTSMLQFIFLYCLYMCLSVHTRSSDNLI